MPHARFELCDFKAEAELGEVTMTIANAKCMSGSRPDFPEDVAGGLKGCTKLAWGSKTRVLVHIADAPAHGEEYHEPGMHDDYGGRQDPDPAEMIAYLGNTKRVNYYFVRITQHTDKMISKFRQAHASSRKDFQEYKLGDDVGMFAETVINSIRASVRSSRVGGGGAGGGHGGGYSTVTDDY